MHSLASRIGPHYVLPACALLVLPVAIAAPLMTTWLAVIAGLACLPHLDIRKLARSRGATLMLAAAALLILWSAVGSQWSVAPAHSLQKAVELIAFTVGGTALLLGALQVDANGQRRIGNALIAGLIIAAAIIVFERVTDVALANLLAGTSENRLSPLSHLNRAASLLALYPWLAIALMWERFSFPALLATLAVPFVLLLSLDPSTPVLAFAFAAAIFLLGRWRPHIAGVALAGIVLATFIGAPFADHASAAIASLFDSFNITESTIRHRFDIWAFVGERIMDRPLSGWGLDASRAIPGGDTVITNEAGQIPNRLATNLPLHPHNAPLQVWAELGLPGALIAAAIATTAITATARLAGGRARAAASLAVVAAAVLVSEMSYGIWQGWWLSTLWLIAAFIIVAAAHERGPEH